MDLIDHFLSYMGLDFGVAVVVVIGAVGVTLFLLARGLQCSVTEAANAIATVLNALHRKGRPRQSGNRD
jgi:hypothetical protein